MKKVFGVQAEVNITADEEVVKGIGKGISKGAIAIGDIIKSVKPEIEKALKDWIKEDKNKCKENK